MLYPAAWRDTGELSKMKKLVEAPCDRNRGEARGGGGRVALAGSTGSTAPTGRHVSVHDDGALARLRLFSDYKALRPGRRWHGANRGRAACEFGLDAIATRQQFIAGELGKRPV